ncbi:3,4-dehydroadipyl-CoA semialdehyde dehydrogenase [Arenibaculum sp.]|uniref:3,4-dehydroadipyl-CoA semialdehyde dehydrogenase n=1 Tax=Arenibaculum sp. TaxID=2865862 RepID=UPI002E0E7010|nr:3,4-dehydroadipyl-CoA semialdehyde dehydrogenase [Arenibaculum sp.]
MNIENYVAGRWIAGTGAGQPLVDPTTGAELARASTGGIDFAAALAHAREVGGPALRRLTYGGRAQMLRRIADCLAERRADYVGIARANSGNTDTDAAIDVDGAIGTVGFFARAGQKLGDARLIADGGLIRMGKDEAFQALHVMAPVRGAAIHINAFNFPAWGLWEKAAVSLLAGVPVVAKPATVTCWLAQRMVRDVIEAGILPDGALSILCGGAGDLLDHVAEGDVIAFTGSADTAARIRGHRRVVERSVRVNVEADSLNACILGPDIRPDAPEFDLFVREVAREMTVKAGQKCTAIRRVLVPASVADAAAEAIAARLARTPVGDPRNPEVRMGPLVGRDQLAAARDGLAALAAETGTVFDGAGSALVDADPDCGAFLFPTLLRANDPAAARAVHEVEVFGPVSTLMAYRDADDAFALARRGRGSLVASVFTADPGFMADAAIELADMHGRILLIDASVGKASTGHGIVMPMCLHGGPGRAGGGEELGGLRGLAFYHQRSALQGPAARLEAIAAGAARIDA